jgi:hypothetical protein
MIDWFVSTGFVDPNEIEYLFEQQNKNEVGASKKASKMHSTEV